MIDTFSERDRFYERKKMEKKEENSSEGKGMD